MAGKLILAILAAGALPGAFAQSTQKLYGVMDAGFSYSNGNSAGALTSLESGIESGPRLGLKGEEELGDGLRAIYVLEAGININDGTSGQGGRLFGRQAFAGFSGVWGTTTMGRQYTPIFLAYDSIDPFNTGTTGDMTTLFGRNSGFASIDTRMDNAIVYSSPVTTGNFSASVAYSFGGQSGDVSADSQSGLSLRYLNGPVKVVYAYHEMNNASSLIDTSTYKSHFLGSVVDAGKVRLHLAFDQTTQGEGYKSQSYLLGFTLPSGQDSFFGDYKYTENRHAGAMNSGQYALGYNYYLSRHTNLYAAVSYTLNDADSSVNTDVAGKSVTRVQLGLRHIF